MGASCINCEINDHNVIWTREGKLIILLRTMSIIYTYEESARDNIYIYIYSLLLFSTFTANKLDTTFKKKLPQLHSNKHFNIYSHKFYFIFIILLPLFLCEILYFLLVNFYIHWFYFIFQYTNWINTFCHFTLNIF